MTSADQVLQACRELLLAGGRVHDGWTPVRADLVDGSLQLVFRWRALPHLLAVRHPLDDLDEGPWTGMPTASAQEWVWELSGRLDEELHTGGTAWLQRVERDGVVELLWDRPRVDALPVELGSAYYLSDVTVHADEWVHEDGLDPGPALAAARRGDLSRWWVTYVNDRRGRPYVAQLVVTRTGTGAVLEFVQAHEDLPRPLASALVAQAAYTAVHDAACDGATSVTTTLEHPGLDLLDLSRDGAVRSWRADGPLLTPPVLDLPTTPRRLDDPEPPGPDDDDVRVVWGFGVD